MGTIGDAERDLAVDAAEAAGAVLLDLFAGGVTVEHKGDRDLVSVADRTAEELIRRRIAARFPDDVVVGEEGDPVAEEAVRGRRRWYVDPVDGTTNFVKGRRWWGVSIGFVAQDDRLAAGAVHVPCRGETYAATRGGGATRDGETIRCSDVQRISEALVTTGFPAAIGTDNVAAWERVVGQALSARVMGAVALDLCAVASGVSDGLWTLRTGPWDVAAGMLIAAEAGAVVTDLRNNPLHAPRPALLVAAPGVHRALLDLVTGGG